MIVRTTNIETFLHCEDDDFQLEDSLDHKLTINSKVKEVVEEEEEDPLWKDDEINQIQPTAKGFLQNNLQEQDDAILTMQG